MYLDFKETPFGPIQSVVSGGGAGVSASGSPPATVLALVLSVLCHISFHALFFS